MEILAQKQVPVEVCISSNLRTGVCRSLLDHPVKMMFENGLMITLSTDDPEMFQTTLFNEYDLARREFRFSEDHLREVARNAFEASFLAPDKKLEFLQRIDALAL